jgi:hypothetical protein
LRSTGRAWVCRTINPAVPWWTGLTTLCSWQLPSGWSGSRRWGSPVGAVRGGLRVEALGAADACGDREQPCSSRCPRCHRRHGPAEPDCPSDCWVVWPSCGGPSSPAWVSPRAAARIVSSSAGWEPPWTRNTWRDRRCGRSSRRVSRRRSAAGAGGRRGRWASTRGRGGFAWRTSVPPCTCRTESRTRTLP